MANSSVLLYYFLCLFLGSRPSFCRRCPDHCYARGKYVRKRGNGKCSYSKKTIPALTPHGLNSLQTIFDLCHMVDSSTASTASTASVPFEELTILQPQIIPVLCD
ncbi:hypothetical protein BX600DRAFT_444424 [Xylariales sp. PMI_506]|nr:hypothetical protein BX600DRAFT_444424 [Xylariales sp. PMI_506]